MKRKQYALALALLVVAGLLGGALSGRLLAVTAAPPTAQAQQRAAAKTFAGQKYEYSIALTRAASSLQPRRSYWISYFPIPAFRGGWWRWKYALERNGPARPRQTREKAGDDNRRAARHQASELKRVLQAAKQYILHRPDGDGTVRYEAI